MSTSTPYIINLDSKSSALKLDKFEAVNVNTTTNLNNNNGFAFTNFVPIVGNVTRADSDSFEVVDNTQVRCLFSGEVKLQFNIYLFSNGARNGVGFRFKKENIPFGPIAASTYIRNSTSHNESSAHCSTYTNVISGDIISIGSTRLTSNSSSTNMSIAGASNIILERFYT